MNFSTAAREIAAIGDPNFDRWIKNGCKKSRDRTAKLNEEAEKRERQRLKDKETEKIFKGDDWRELTVGYTHRYYEVDRWGMRYGDEVTEFVKMDTPRKCSYSSQT
eukprot:CAMPEP_0198258270 /NCGR_PEP_ID=MMETSP1447-20131203/7743_1 /TAXON_ID=420782 /ORGANISM="Chaetoceros dichaeta, Strain CCMP1751" /LENGTH=105 /DNA_ID=CAMNT_0043945351 /DNA_START=12 /DNA_END=326 /DNA_ORIENTATION=-